MNNGLASKINQKWMNSVLCAYAFICATFRSEIDFWVSGAHVVFQFIIWGAGHPLPFIHNWKLEVDGRQWWVAAEISCTRVCSFDLWSHLDLAAL